LHIDRIYALQVTAIFIFGRFCLKLSIQNLFASNIPPKNSPFGDFLGYYSQMNFDIVATAKGPSFGEKITSYEP